MMGIGDWRWGFGWEFLNDGKVGVGSWGGGWEFAERIPQRWGYRCIDAVEHGTLN